MLEQEFEGARQQMTSADVAALAGSLRTLGRAATDAAEQVEQIRRLEELKSAAAAAQARVTTLFARSQRGEQEAAEVPADQLGTGIAAQVGLARRDSPARGSRHLAVAQALTSELPHTLAALEGGEVSEWRATLVVRETACLTVEHRRQVDAELAALPGGMGALGDRAIAQEARRIGYRLDPYALTKRAAQAASERRVSLRPAPDTMTWLRALLPVTEGVAAYAALIKAAGTARASSDSRSRGQVMADTLVERITGQAQAAAVPVEVQLIMTDQTLLSGGQEPAEVTGYGPLPAPLARELLRGDCTGPVTQQADSDSAGRHREAERAKVWLRRLYTKPDGSALVAMDSRRRCFEGQLREFLIAADRHCRTPWCDAPIRHLDHGIPAAHGGKTTAADGQGLCEACNYARTAHAWRAVLHPDRVVETITPTGHSYTSRPPPAVGYHPPARADSALEQYLGTLIEAAA
jgi:Domain of unknown function (DUF222)